MSSRFELDCASLRSALLQRAEGARAGDSRDGGSAAPGAGATPGRSGREAGPGTPADAVLGSQADLDAHLDVCADCRRALARAERLVGLVGGLARASAPAALDGAVVAALQAGARQDRASRAVAGLTPVAAPDDLARRIALPRAPAVLERLVAEELADPQKAVASRYTRRLERLRAPADLEERLGRPARRAPSRLLPRALFLLGFLIAAGALFLTQTLRDTPRGEPSAPSGVVLVVEHVGSVRDLDPVAGQLLSGFTGGLLDADRLTREGS